MISLYPNNLAQDLLLSHRVIAGGGGVAPQDEGESTSDPFIYIHYAMGKKIFLKAIEDNVSPLKIGWCYWLNRDHVFMANGGMHACSRGPETHSEAEAEQLTAQKTKTRR